MVIRSPDSDVATIALSVTHHIDTQLIVRAGTHHRTRYLDLIVIGRGLGREMCNVLPGYHAFTGCDSTIAFTGRGKVSGFRLLKDDVSFRNAMAGIGQSFGMYAEQLAKGEQAICTLYGRKQLTNVNSARHRMFRTQTTDPCNLPPCQSADQNHPRRANYQAAIWMMCLETAYMMPTCCLHETDILSPRGYGCVVTDYATMMATMITNLLATWFPSSG